jgi:hypothetical protein
MISRPCTEVLAVLLCAAATSAQENRGTLEQRAACTRDALRLCGSYVPGPTKVEHCLRQNISGLRRPADRSTNQAQGRSPAEVNS